MTSDQSTKASEKQRGNDEGPDNQEEKKNEERPQLTIEKVGNFTDGGWGQLHCSWFVSLTETAPYH